MADKIKEISSGTYTIGALSNGVTIATTNATTQLVVKDIHVQNNQLNSLGMNLNFAVNGVNAANINSSVSGSEIIDVSSTAVARTTASFYNDVVGFFGPTNAASAKATTVSSRNVNGVPASTAVTQSASGSVLTYSQNIAGQWFVGSDFFYLYDDGNSSQILFRRAGGINGTESQVWNESYCTIVFNGVDRFHQVAAGAIRTYVPSTQTTTSVNIQNGGSWPFSVSSYPRISYANGLVFWYHNNSQSAWAINPTTGYVAFISSAMIVNSSNTYTPLEVYYSGGNYYFLSVNNNQSSGTIYISRTADFGPLTSASLNNVTATNIYNTPTVQITANVSLVSLWPKLNRTNGDWVWFKSNLVSGIYTFGCFNMLTQTIKPDIVINTNLYPPLIPSPSNLVLASLTSGDDSANKLNTTFYPQTATLRVTGVETTL